MMIMMRIPMSVMMIMTVGTPVTMYTMYPSVLSSDSSSITSVDAVSLSRMKVLGRFQEQVDEEKRLDEEDGLVVQQIEHLINNIHNGLTPERKHVVAQRVKDIWCLKVGDPVKVNRLGELDLTTEANLSLNSQERFWRRGDRGVEFKRMLTAVRREVQVLTARRTEKTRIQAEKAEIEKLLRLKAEIEELSFVNAEAKEVD
jgi:hypothetical protein